MQNNQVIKSQFQQKNQNKIKQKNNQNHLLPRLRYTGSADKSIEISIISPKTRKITRGRESRKNSIVIQSSVETDKIKFELNPLRQLENNIKRKLSKNHMSELETPKEVESPLKKKSKIYSYDCPLYRIGKLDKIEKEDYNRVKIKMGQQKSNSILRILFLNKIRFNHLEDKENNKSYLYYITVSSGLVSGKSPLFPFETLNESELEVSTNNRVIKKTLTITFYQVQLPDLGYNRRKIGFFQIQTPEDLQKSTKSPQQISLSSKIWDGNDEYVQDAKLYIKAFFCP